MSRVYLEKLAALPLDVVGRTQVGAREYARLWGAHSALNAGMAMGEGGRALRNAARGRMSEARASGRSAAGALKYTVLPPTGIVWRGRQLNQHHTLDELTPLRQRTLPQWFLEGLRP